MPLIKLNATLGLTGALPAVSGANLTGVSAGKVLQCISTTYTSLASTTSGTPADVSGFSATITPASSSNKVLIFLAVAMGGVANSYGYCLLKRGSTSIAIGTSGSGSQANSTISSGYIDGAAAFRNGANSHLDSPNTTSATTYKVQIAQGNGSNAFYINRQSSSSDNGYIQFPVSTITLMEIEG